MPKSELNKTERPRKTVDLAGPIGRLVLVPLLRPCGAKMRIGHRRGSNGSNSKQSTSGPVKCSAQFVLQQKDCMSLEEKRAFCRLSGTSS